MCSFSAFLGFLKSNVVNLTISALVSLYNRVIVSFLENLESSMCTLITVSTFCSSVRDLVSWTIVVTTRSSNIVSMSEDLQFSERRSRRISYGVLIGIFQSMTLRISDSISMICSLDDESAVYSDNLSINVMHDAVSSTFMLILIEDAARVCSSCIFGSPLVLI